MTDELGQWCEIDGHNWITHYMCRGLVLGPKRVDITKICRFCKTCESITSEPSNYDIPYLMPIFGPMISFL